MQVARLHKTKLETEQRQVLLVLEMVGAVVAVQMVGRVLLVVQAVAVLTVLAVRVFQVRETQAELVLLTLVAAAAVVRQQVVTGQVQTAATAATRILHVIDTLEPAANGGFFDQRGRVIDW